MDTNIRRLLKEIGAEDLIEVFAPCMDDYLYIIDLQKNTLIISQEAVKRFKMPGNSFDNAADSVRYFVYEEDRPMIREHLQRIADGNEKNHNLHYRWLDKEGMPVWINCRGTVSYTHLLFYPFISTTTFPAWSTSLAVRMACSNSFSGNS